MFTYALHNGWHRINRGRAGDGEQRVVGGWRPLRVSALRETLLSAQGPDLGVWLWARFPLQVYSLHPHAPQGFRSESWSHFCQNHRKEVLRALQTVSDCGTLLLCPATLDKDPALHIPALSPQAVPPPGVPASLSPPKWPSSPQSEDSAQGVTSPRMSPWFLPGPG